MGVVEEQVILTCQLDFHILDAILTDASKKKHFDPDCFQCTDFLRPLLGVLNSQLKWSLSIEHYCVTLSYNMQSIS